MLALVLTLVLTTSIHRCACVLQWKHLDVSRPLDHTDFMATLHRYPIVVVDFYAPWCPFCKRMEPSWEAATKAVHEKYPEETDGRIRFAKASQ